MTAIERAIAKLGISGVLLVLLAGSVVVNVWLVSRNAKAKSACDERIAALVAEVDRKTAEAESLSLRIGRETAVRAQADSDRIQSETVRYVERIRRVEVPVPAECHTPMPDGVRDALTDATRAANRRV